MATVICLGGGIEGMPIIQAVKALGHAVVVVDGNPDAPGMALADQAILASCYDAEETVGAINLGYHPDGVLCCAVDAPNVAAYVAQEFDLPGLTPTMALLSVDKVFQKAALQGSGLPVPGFHTWPRIVIKPPNLRGARGVKLIETGGMVEQYLDGPQLSTESLVQDGGVLFTTIGLRNYGRLAEFAPHIIEDGFDGPYPADGVDKLIAQACQALGWYQQGGGVVKGDLVIHNGQLVIIELAARLSGGFFCLSHEWAYGVPFIESAIRLALGERLEPPTVKPGKFVSQRYVFPAPDDIGRRVVSLGPSWPPYGLRYATYALHPGDVIQPVTSHGQRWGQAIALGDTPQQARARAEQVVAEMKKAVVLE